MKRRGSYVYPSSWCRECDRASCAQRYRGSLRGRILKLWNGAKGRHQDKPFNITRDYLEALFGEQDGRCFYTGRMMTVEPGPDAVSLERRDPRRGYEIGNVVLACWAVNDTKGSLTDDAFIALCRAVVTHQDRSTASTGAEGWIAAPLNRQPQEHVNA